MVCFQGKETIMDVSRLLKNTQRKFFSFGYTNLGERPTIVPVKTLACKEKAKEGKEVLNSCTDPNTGKSVACKVKLGPQGNNMKKQNRKRS